MPWIEHTQPKETMTTLPKMPTPPTSQAKRVKFGKINTTVGHRVVLYGPGGIGKTTSCVSAPGPVAFFDLDESLARLSLATPPSVVDAPTWTDLRSAINSDGWDDIRTIVIDSITKAEELCVAHTLSTIMADGGKRVSNVEGYGYGKGYGYVFDTFLPLLSDLDRHCRAGRNVILIAHDCTTNVPNPSGEDWLRYEPRLQSPNSGKASIRLRVREWADHVLFLGYDVAVDNDGKGKGSGTRTLWPAELPHCMAKSRTTQSPIALSDSTNLWAEIIK